jgi:hypothetical protein
MLKWLTKLARIEFPPAHGRPAATRLAVASAVSIIGSLIADAVIVALGEAVWPATRGYEHFAFADYGELTVIGVVAACAGWPIVTWVCAAPRWLFLRLAVLVTAILLLPDVYIWFQGQPGDAVTVLMIMHVAIGVVTYGALTRIAPTRGRPGGRGDGDTPRLRVEHGAEQL